MGSTQEPEDLFATLAQREADVPSPTCNRRIREHCTGDLKACHRMSTRVRSIASLALVLFVSVALLFIAHRPLSGFSAAALFGAMGWASVEALILVLGLARRQETSSRRLRLALAFVVPAAFFVYLTLTRTATEPLGEFLSHGDETRHALHCGAFSFVIGAAAALGIAALWRRTDPFTPRLSGALAGLLGGLAAAIPIGLVCPGTDGWHLWSAHGISLVLVILMGTLLGRRWLSP